MALRRSTFDIDAALRNIAHAQLGLVTVRQAERSGIDRRALYRRIQCGTLERIFPEVFRWGGSEPTTQQRILGAALAVAGSEVAGPSSALVHGLPLPAGFVTPTSRVVLLVPSSRVVRIPGIRAIRFLSPVPSGPWQTVRLSTPASTVVLLSRFLDAGSLERCLDHSIAHKLVSASQLTALVRGLPPHAVPRRQVLLDLFASRTQGVGHRSRLEQRVGKWLNSAGLDGWRPNYNVVLPRGGRVEVDFAWVEERVALELSPFFTHGSRQTQERDAERRRQLLLAGWRVVEVLDPDLIRELAFAETVATIRRLLTPRAFGPSGRD